MASSNPLFEELEEQSDTISYWLFPHDSEGNRIKDLLSLEQLSFEYFAHLFPFIHNYLWNCDSFNLHVKEASSSSSNDPDYLDAHIEGRITVGDYIEDEWFIVFLLKVLTKDYPGLICRVVDNDGEFLLIEAADHLPKWVNPNSAEQRVYLKEGKVHLIPPSIGVQPSNSSSKPPTRGSPPRVMDAIATLNARPSDTLANPGVQKAVQFRIQDYPSKISKDQHIAHAYVPVGVAALLREYPTLVAPSVRAFCKREDKDSKILRVMRHFPPEQRVQTAVRFSKALFAQLSAYSYTPDKLTGWNLPPPSHPSYKSHLLGMKLACGFEILVCKAGGVTPHTPSNETPPSNLTCDPSELESNPKWLKFKESLTQKGYFRGETENSKTYSELEENAQHFFLSNTLLNLKESEGAETLSRGVMIIKLLSKVNSDYEFFKEREARLSPPDDENWLQINPESLDDFLENKYGKPSKSNDVEKEKEAMESLNSFLNNIPEADESDIPPELRDSARKLSGTSYGRKTSHGHSRKPSTGGRKISHGVRKVSSQSNASEGSNASEMSSFSNKIDFNAEAFSDAIHNILELSVPEDDYWRHSDSDSSGMSSYEDEDDELSLSRKTSSGSQESKSSQASSGVDADHMEGYVKSMKKEAKLVQKQAKDVNPTGCKPKKRGQRIPLAEIDDEFENVDDFDPVGVDLEEVKELMKKFTVSRDGSQIGSFGPIDRDYKK